MSVSLFRYVPLSVHGMVEILAAPMIMAAPFVLDMTMAATVVCFAVGAILFSLSISLIDPRSLPLTAHAEFDYVLGAFAVVAGLAIGIATGDAVATIFLVGVGVAQTALTASTRFSAPRGT